MPVAFNPPPLPTPDRALAAPPDKADEAASANAEPFAAALSAAHARAGEAPARTGKPLVRGSDGESAPSGGRTSPHEDRDAEPTDAAALAAALQALLPAIGVSPPASGPVSTAPRASATTIQAAETAKGTGRDATGGQAMTRTEVAAVPVPAPAPRADPGAALPAAGDPAAAVPEETGAAVVPGWARLDQKLIDGAVARDIDARSSSAAKHADARATPFTAVPVRSDAAPTLADRWAVARESTARAIDDPLAQQHAGATHPDGSGISNPTITPPPPAAPHTAVVHTVAIETPALTSAWRHEVVQEIAQLVVLRHDRAELHVTPPNLGPISVQVSMDAGQANLLVTAPQPATRDALELMLPQLRDSLAQQGITLGQASVQDDRPRSSFAAAEDGGHSGASADATAVQESVTVPAAVRARGLIDLFA